MIQVTTDNIMKSFIEWNGWGPPESEFQIQEYCAYNCDNEQDADFITGVLFQWMNGEIGLL